MPDPSMLRTGQPEALELVGYWTGNSTSDMAKVVGHALTVTRTGVGVHTLAWNFPGAVLACLPLFALAANTPTSIDRYTVISDLDSYSAANRTISFTIFDESG